jgi:DNA-binding response OmpR family regulator
MRPYRLLVVEADRHSFDQLREAISEMGHECEVALDLETAMNILEERRMDVTVVNLQLTECEEEELIEGLQEKVPSMHLVLYNGSAERTRRRRLRRMGADSYLTRASDLGAVVRAVRRVIQRKL